MKWGFVVSNTLFKTVLMDKSVGTNILGTGRCKFPSGAFSIHCCTNQSSVTILVNVGWSNTAIPIFIKSKAPIFTDTQNVPQSWSLLFSLLNMQFHTKAPLNLYDRQILLKPKRFCWKNFLVRGAHPQRFSHRNDKSHHHSSVTYYFCKWYMLNTLSY